MKRLLICILLSICLLGLTGCAEKEDPVIFYYPKAEISYHSDSGVIAQETREALSRENSLSYLLSFYLEGPIDPNLRSAVPEGVQLLRMIPYDGGMLLVMSREFSQLDGVDLSIACISISRTCFELTDLQEITFSAGNQKNVLRTISRDGIEIADTVTQTNE